MRRPVNIALVSDIHIGYTAYGARTFEQDSYTFCKAFPEIIRDSPDTIDMVLVGGDLFNRSSPHIRALMEGYAFLRELDGLGIPVFVIAGNHDMPATPGNPCIFGIFDHLDNVRLVHGDTIAETVELEDDRTVNLVAVPHMHDIERWRSSILDARVLEDVDANILMTHAAVSIGENTFSHGRFDELVLGSDLLDAVEDFDLVGLGHFHLFAEIRPGVVYPGSPYPLRRTDSGQKERGYLQVSISDEGARVELVHVPHRRFIEFPRVDLWRSEMFEDDIVEFVMENHESDPVDDELPPVAYIDLDGIEGSTPMNERYIREQIMRQGFSHVSVRIALKRPNGEWSRTEGAFEMAPVEDMFETFIEGRVADPSEKSAIMRMMREILDEEVVE